MHQDWDRVFHLLLRFQPNRCSTPRYLVVLRRAGVHPARHHNQSSPWIIACNMLDIQLLKLQYEILNVSIDALAAETDIPADFLQEEINRLGWARMWPEEGELPLVADEGEDVFKLQSDAFIDKARRRLCMYQLAKDALLATRYLELEAGIIKKANECLSHIDPQAGAAAVKTLSSLWRDMQKNSAQATAFSVGTDETGLPTVIVKDLSGRPI